jgi:hypothetical protein
MYWCSDAPAWDSELFTILPWQLLAADKGDILANERAGPTDYRNARLAHPIVASAHIGFTCASNTEVQRIAEMA